jgi:hypothetical protein
MWTAKFLGIWQSPFFSAALLFQQCVCSILFMTAEAALADQFPQPPDHAQIVCSRCQLPLKGQLVRALQGVFHLDCFTCLVSQSDTRYAKNSRNITNS